MFTLSEQQSFMLIFHQKKNYVQLRSIDAQK